MEVDPAFLWGPDDGIVHLVVEAGYRQGNQVHANMVPEESEVVLVDDRTGSLHLDPAERVLHELHHHAEIGEELPVLLWLGIPSQHDCVTSVVAGELKTFQVVFEIQIEKRQIIVHLVLICIAVHLADTKGAVVDAFLIRYDDGKRLNFQEESPPKLSFINTPRPTRWKTAMLRFIAVKY